MVVGKASTVSFPVEFIEDSPVDIAALIKQRYLEAIMRKLDEDIVHGNGDAQEPHGLMGVSPVESARMALSEDEIIQRQQTEAFRRGTMPGMTIMIGNVNP